MAASRLVQRTTRAAAGPYLQCCKRLRVGCAGVRMLSELVRVHHHLQLAKRFLQQGHLLHQSDQDSVQCLPPSAAVKPRHVRVSCTPSDGSGALSPTLVPADNRTLDPRVRVSTHRRRGHAHPPAPPPAFGEAPHLMRQRRHRPVCVPQSRTAGARRQCTQRRVCIRSAAMDV